ncbi:MAG: ferredoxin:protochlorophyllide reductase (ATP-dependent) subunit B [Chloroflexota bacterium]
MRLAYWMYEGTAHHGVGRITNSLQKVHAIFHAPQGDDYVNPIFTMLERTPDFPQMTTSVVSGSDLAMGTIRLPETLRQVDAKLQPELIVVCASCSTILLQENLQQVADNIGDEIGAEVLVYDANPYRMQEIVAAEGLLTTLVKRFATERTRTERPSVNIIGPASLGFHTRQDLICLRRIMQTLGVEINAVVPLGSSLDDLRGLAGAWVNIAPYRELGQGAANYLESTFGTPTLYDAPMGVQPTLKWLNKLVEMLNEVAKAEGKSAIEMPHLTKFSLDGMSAPSGVPWFARTADMESFSSKRAFVFGDATHTVGMVKFLRDELAMEIAGAGTYLAHEADWVREQLDGYLPRELLVTDEFQQVAKLIDKLAPDLVCGTQMERHACRKFDIPVMVIAPPTHIENHLLSYTPMLGFDGADYLADTVYTTATLGLEKHLIDLFGDAGLDYDEDEQASAEETPVNEVVKPVGSVSVEGMIDVESILWTEAAEKTLKRVPFFVRKKVRRNTEKFAAENGYQEVTADVLQAAREAIGG